MRTSPRLVVIGIVVSFALAGGIAHARDAMNAANDALKPGREVNEDGSLAARSGNLSHRPGREVDENIMQPGKHLGSPGRNIEDGTYDWDKVTHKSRRALNDEPAKKQTHSKQQVEE
jgi:hypothetical protein